MIPPAVLFLGAICLFAQTPDARISALAAQLAQAPDAAVREAIFNANPELLRHALVMELQPIVAMAIDRRESVAAARGIDALCAVAARLSDPLGLGLCSYNRGMLLSNEEKMDDSKARFEEAIARFQPAGEHAWAARALNGIAILYSRRSEYAEAQPLLERAMQEAERSGERERVAQTSVNLAIGFNSQGNYRAATQAFQRALDICRELGLERQSAKVLTGLASVYNYQRDFELGLRYAQEALKISEKFNDIGTLPAVYGNLALPYQGLGQFDKARQYLELELKLAADTDDPGSRMMALYNYGDLLRELKQSAAAVPRFEESLRLGLQLGRRAMVVHNRITLAELANESGRWAEALKLCEEAAPDAHGLGELILVARLGDARGTALMRMRRSAEAEASLREAIDAIETMRRQLAGEQETMAIFMRDKVDVYHRMVELLLAGGRTEEALGFAERAKARVVLDILLGARERLTKSMTPAEQRQESTLVERMAALAQELIRQSGVPKPDKAKVDATRARLEIARLEHRALANTLYAAHASLRLQRADFEPATAAQLAAAMPDANGALLEYVVTDRAVSLFVLTRDANGTPQLRAYALPDPPAKIAAEAAAFRQQIATRDLEYGNRAQALYRMLLGAAREQLRGKTALVIVPDRFLWQVPFQALQAAPGRHLIEQQSVFYAPSLAVLRELARSRGAAPVQPKVLAVDGAQLASAVREVTGLRDLYGAGQTTVYMADQADEEVVKRQAPLYDVLHLAAHGIFQDEQPMLSYILLAKAGKAETGSLAAREMMDLDLKANLVVLSGCETGRGAAGNGEGLIGMSWALMVAGSPTTVASQWKVDAASTTEMMLAFHTHLQHEGKARSLQLAAQTILRKPAYRHPFYWSGFAMIGQGF